MVQHLGSVFRSRNVSDRAEDSRTQAIREQFSLTGSTPRRRPGEVYLLNCLINYLINYFKFDFPYLRVRDNRKPFASKQDLLVDPNMLSTK